MYSEEQILEFYEKNQHEIDEAWEIQGVEEYGFDVTEWSGWDSMPDIDFIYEFMVDAESYAAELNDGILRGK